MLLKKDSLYGVVGVYSDYSKALDALHLVSYEAAKRRPSMYKMVGPENLTKFITNFKESKWVKIFERGTEWDDVGNPDRTHTIYLVCVRKDIPRA